MDQADPARNFFDEGEEVDLYGVLGVEAAAPEAEIKRAYKR
jgi:curved DNA-binding protein CbpA